MLSYGGQTALNCGVKIDESGILKKYGVSVLGTQIPGIMAAEDRQKFKDAMVECNDTYLGPNETLRNLVCRLLLEKKIINILTTQLF